MEYILYHFKVLFAFKNLFLFYSFINLIKINL
nr:MAG TPA: hypothetical protein [Bacteriophage sp.]